MAFIRSQLFCVFLSVLVVLFCVDLAWRVEGGTIVQTAYIGDDITLSCDVPGRLDVNYMKWYRNEILIAAWNGVYINDPRFTRGVTQYGNHHYNNLYISNIRIDDSDTFNCRSYYEEEIQSYDLRVMYRCSNCKTADISDSDKIKVICTVDNYWTSNALSKYVVSNENIHLPAVIQGSDFSFSINVTELYMLRSEFYLQIETESMITCMLPTQPTPPSSPTTTLPTTSLKPTTQNGPSTLSYTASKKLPVGISTSISTTHHTPKNKNSNFDNSTRDSNVTLIIVILGSVFVLILVVIIIVLRCKKTKDRRDNKNTGNASIKKEHPEVCHESGKDGSGKSPEYATSIKELRETSLDQRNADHLENGEMIDNILYASRDKIADSSISRVEGPLDDALYAMPDKRATINRESKSSSKVTDGSSNSNHLYGNSAIITQHEQNRGTLQQGDRYENVKMPGSGGDAEEIPLYDMPDKGPTRNTLKTTPKAGQTPTLPKDEVVSVDALYAEVDKTKKKYTNN